MSGLGLPTHTSPLRCPWNSGCILLTLQSVVTTLPVYGPAVSYTSILLDLADASRPARDPSKGGVSLSTYFHCLQVSAVFGSPGSPQNSPQVVKGEPNWKVDHTITTRYNIPAAALIGDSLLD